MKFFKKLKKILEKQVVLGIGNFDGLHLGHKDIISRVISSAKRAKVFSALITFSPHPRQVLNPKKSIKLLTNSLEKRILLSKTGLDFLFELKFNKEIANFSPYHFISYLKKFLNIKKIVVGFNFAFGMGRSGHIRKLKKIGKKLRFQVEVRKPVIVKNKVVSSSGIRKMIERGNLKEANLRLGHFYPVFGKVIKGKGIGRKLGFPTANLLIGKEKIIPRSGVYLALVEINNKKMPALVNIKFDKFKKEFSFEVFILKFRGNLYHKLLKVFLIKKLRAEKKFNNLRLLQKQISCDFIKALKFFRVYYQKGKL